MSNYFILHTKKQLKSLEINLENDNIVLQKINKNIAHICCFPKIYYENNKEYFYWIEYIMYFNPCCYPDFFEWIEKELKNDNEVSLIYMTDVNIPDTQERWELWEKYNSVYKKEYIKIQEVIDNPDKLDFTFNIEYEFIL